MEAPRSVNKTTQVHRLRPKQEEARKRVSISGDFGFYFIKVNLNIALALHYFLARLNEAESKR